MACCSRCYESEADGQADVLQVEMLYVQLQLVNSDMHEPRNNAAGMCLVQCAVKRVKASQQRCG